jgi:putative transposase
MIIGTKGDKHGNIVRDMKRYTSEEMRRQVTNHPQESRKEWMLSKMESVGKGNSNNMGWQFWQQHNKPIELRDSDMALRILSYIHNNPIVAGFVEEPVHWLYSSALNYCRRKGLVDVCLIV